MKMQYREMIASLTEMKAELLSEENDLLEASASMADVVSDEELADMNDIGDDEAFLGYMEGIVARLMDMGLSEDDAQGLFAAVAEEMANEGDLPPLPESDDSPFDFTDWLAAARSSGFESTVFDAVSGR